MVTVNSFHSSCSDKIERSNLDGNYRETIVDSVIHPFAVSVWGHYLYWTDWQLGKTTYQYQHVFIQHS